jgi:hypothetical protein
MKTRWGKVITNKNCESSNVFRMISMFCCTEHSASMKTFLNLEVI